MNAKTKKILNTVINVFLIFAIIILLASFVFKQSYLNIVVEGNSMNPTIENMEMGYMKKTNQKSKIERFDIVAVDVSNNEVNQSTYWIKRIIALPYEKVKISGNELYINDELLEQPFSILGDTNRCDCEYELANEYLIAGDNRQASVLPIKISKNQIKAKNGFVYRKCLSYDFSNNVCTIKGEKEWRTLH